jgi:molecular chaperone DnaK
VEDLLIPAAARQCHLPDLARGDPRWRGVVNKLKLAAEAAKIRLSRASTADVLVDVDDGHGHRMEFEYELRRDQLDLISEPFIVRSINLCRKALQQAQLEPGNITKTILVGGPTLSPYLRERLADPRTGLGIPLDHRHDPLTVVARGAAIFAGTQRIPQSTPTAPAPHQFTVQLEYQPIGPDTEPLIAGRIHAPTGTELGRYTIELANPDARPPWRSGKITVTSDGTFAATLWADRGRANTFTLELSDATGAGQPVTPNRLTYTVGVVETQPPLTQSLGIGLQSNDVIWLMQRGTPLPARHRVSLRTTVPVRAGETGGMIRIPVVEGEHRRADRNRRVGRVEVPATHLSRDVPVGSEVQLSIEIDTSRLVTAKAYLPILDAEFEHAINLHTEEIPDLVALSRDRAEEYRRLDEVRSRNTTLRHPVADMLLTRIDEEHIVTEISSLQQAAAVDPDAAITCRKRILDLRAAIDEVEETLQWPDLLQASADMLARVTLLVHERGHAADHAQLAAHSSALRHAEDSHDVDLLSQRIDDLVSLGRRILERTGELSLMMIDDLRDRRDQMRDTARADQLFNQANNAAESQDVPRLRTIIQQLVELLPSAPPPPDPFSTVTRG